MSKLKLAGQIAALGLVALLLGLLTWKVSRATNPTSPRSSPRASGRLRWTSI